MEDKNCIRLFADEVQITECKKKVGSNSENFEQLSGILKLAGNEVRLKILYLLKEENELCPCDISDVLSMSIPAVSQHLRKLKDGNIVRTRRAGQAIFYSLRTEHLKILKPFFKFINIKEPADELK